jgi:4-amino-4-deoxy-L-arabinose transferase-like glycosyltransferase
MLSKLLSTEDKTYKIIFLIIISFIALFNRINESPIGFDDAFYCQKAKEMVQKKDYFYTNPTIGGEQNFDNKPPMFFWFLSLSGKVFGFNNFSMRLFPAIFGFLGIFVLFNFVGKLYGYDVGFMSSFVLLFTQQYLQYSRSATLESMFCLFFLLALINFWEGFVNKKNINYLLMGIFIGFAVMTRQVSGLLIYGIVILFILLVKEFLIFKNLNFYLGILIRLIIFLPWHIYMILKYENRFVLTYFGVLSRGIVESTNWYEYFRKILENYWPWLPFLVIGLWKETKSVLFNKTNLVESKKTLFILTYILVIFLVFQSLKFKAVQYLVPIYVPFAVIVAKTILDIDKNKNFLWSKIFINMGVVMVVLWTLFPILPKTLDSNEFVDTMKLVPEIKKIVPEIYTLNNVEKSQHYFNGLLFYADKKVVRLNENVFIDMICGKNVNYFVLNKNDFRNVVEKKSLKEKVMILFETDESVLFKNKGI